MLHFNMLFTTEYAVTCTHEARRQLVRLDSQLLFERQHLPAAAFPVLQTVAPRSGKGQLPWFQCLEHGGRCTQQLDHYKNLPEK